MNDGAIGAWIIILIGLVLYFVPSIIANVRNRAVAPVMLLNLFFGWTLIGWVAALIWAATERSAREEAERRALSRR